MVDDLIVQLANGDADLETIAQEVLTRSRSDGVPTEGSYTDKADERARLSAVAAELTTQTKHLHGLYAERTSLMRQRDLVQSVPFDSTREHSSHHQKRDSLRDSRVFDLIEPTVLDAQAPEFATMMMATRETTASTSHLGDPEKTALIELWLQAANADIQRAQIAYQTRWLEAEREHPILIAYRDKPGQKADLSGLTDKDGGDQLMLGVMRSVLPKLANIAKAQTWLQTGDLNPRSLPPVVALAKQDLRIVPGTMRSRVVDDMIADATDDGNQWAIAAITLGLAMLTAIPSGGSSAVLLAELGLLGLDAFLAMETYADFAMAETTAETSIDPAKALASEEPSLTWLAVQLVAVGLGLGFAAKTFREAARLRRATEAGESAQQALRHLDEFGEEHGLGKIGSRIVDEAGERASTARIARPSLHSDRVGQYAAENADGLARRLGTGVQVDSSLGSGVRVERFVHDDGDVWVIGLRVGPDATTADVLAHGKTIELMRRYNGTIGDFRAVLDRGLGKAVRKPGSTQEVASLEAEKLGRLIRERQKALGTVAVDIAAPVLEQEIAFLQKRQAKWEAKLLSNEPDKVIVGYGDIGSPDFSRIGKTRTRGQDDTPEYFSEPIHGVGAEYRWVGDQHGHKVKRYLVGDEDALLRVAENAAGGSLDNLVEIKPNWYEGMVDGQRIKIEWQPGGEPVMNEGPHVKIQLWDPEKGKGGKWLAPEKIFIRGKETLNDRYRQ